MPGGEQPPADRASPSREALLSSNQLVSNYTRPLDSEYGTGLPDRLCVGATPTVSSNPPTLFPRTNHSDPRGGDKTPPETSNSAGGSACGDRVPVQHVSSPQEGWRAETSNKSQSSQSVCQHRAFQNGGYSHCERSPETRGLASQSRLERCVLCHPHTPDPQKVPQVSSPRETVPLHLPTVRSVISPMGIHQNAETSLSRPSRDGLAPSGLHRRHSDPGGVQGEGPRLREWYGIPIGMSGLHSQQREIDTRPESDHRISGPNNRHEQHGVASPGTQNKTNSGGVSKVATGRDCLSSNPSTSFGENERNSMCDSTSPSFLSPSTDGTIRHAREKQPELRVAGDPTDHLPRGAELVGHSNVQMEWEINPQDGNRHDNRFGCISDRLGSSLPTPNDRRPMVGRGSRDAYQLPRVAGCHSGSPIICQGEIQDIHPIEDRQYHSGGIHKPPGGHSLQGSSQIDKRPMDVVPGTEYPHHSTTPPRVIEHSCRYRVPDTDRQNRLETESNYLSQDQSPMGPTGSGPLCIPAVISVPTLLQLAARSVCRGDRRIPSDMDIHEGVCQSTLEPGGQDSISSSDTASQHCTDSPSVEVTTMVPNSATDADGLPQVNNIRIPSNAQSGSFNDAPTTSRLAYLRERYRGQRLSEEATDLMLKSWRTKTNRSYDSLFSKWERWCSERSSDPISGPVTEVANFLAYLYKEGYQYSSINSYRSAISSVHDRIEGDTVGQHPLITRLIKGVFHARPPLPRYSRTWDVQTVLNFLQSLGDNGKLSLKHLSWKVSMLLALSRPSRSADLSQLDLSRRVYKPDGVCFYPVALSKQSRQGSYIVHFFFPSLPDDPQLCPVTTLKVYEERTCLLRGKETKLLIAIIKPHKAITSSTVARWLKSLLEASGIDTSIFSAHSVRGASSSAAASTGVSTAEILKAANWSSESVFQRFYYRSTDSPSYGRAVLSQQPATNNTVDMGD